MPLWKTITLGVLRSVAGDKVAGLAEKLVDHLTPKGGILPGALDAAYQQAANVIAVALEDDAGLVAKTVALSKDGDTQQAVKDTRAFIARHPMCDTPEKRRKALGELQQAAARGLLAGAGEAMGAAVAGEVTRAEFLDFRYAERLRGELPGMPRLAAVLVANAGGLPLMMALARRFFILQVQQNAELERVVQLVGMEQLQQSIDALGSKMDALGGKIDQLEERVAARVEQALQRLQLANRPLAARDSFSIQAGPERKLVEQVLAEYRALDEAARAALGHGVGKLLVAAGRLPEASECLGQALGSTRDQDARADIAWSAYRTALEQRAWSEALRNIRIAAAVERFQLFDFERYEPLEILGAGGFGTAYLCRDHYLGAEVVVKALTSEDLEREPEEVFREARLLRKLRHPHLVEVLEVGYGARGKRNPFLVMERAAGQDLATVLGGQPMAAERFLPVARQIATAMVAAHGQGILHRDLKPENVVVETIPNGLHARVIDFGLAVRLGDAPPSGSLFFTDRAGTMRYAPPEQLHGGKLGPWSDVFAFGRLCYAALAGTPEPLQRHRKALPAELVDVLEQCLEPEPGHRLQSFTEVLNGLGAIGAARAKPQPAVIAAAPPPAKPQAAPSPPAVEETATPRPLPGSVIAPPPPRAKQVAPPSPPAAKNAAAPQPPPGGWTISGKHCATLADAQTRARQLARVIAEDVIKQHLKALEELIETGKMPAALAEELELGRELYRQRVPPGILEAMDPVGEAFDALTSRARPTAAPEKPVGPPPQTAPRSPAGGWTVAGRAYATLFEAELAAATLLSVIVDDIAMHHNRELNEAARSGKLPAKLLAALDAGRERYVQQVPADIRSSKSKDPIGDAVGKRIAQRVDPSADKSQSDNLATGPRRVYELAKYLDMTNAELIERIRSIGIDVHNHMSTLQAEDVQRVVRAVGIAPPSGAPSRRTSDDDW